MYFVMKDLCTEENYVVLSLISITEKKRELRGKGTKPLTSTFNGNNIGSLRANIGLDFRIKLPKKKYHEIDTDFNS